MTEPLVPADLDLRDFSYMPLDVVRVRDSELVVTSTGEAFRAAVLLWCAAWHQVPASSLPNDDRLLANLAGFGRDLDAWREVKSSALHGFEQCSDGRLYHPVIAEKALEAAEAKKKQRDRTAAATEARRNTSRKTKRKRDGDRDDVRNDHQGKGMEGNRTEQTLPSGESADAPAKNDGILVPKDWQPNERNIEVAHNAGLTDARIDEETRRFRSYNRARGTLFTDLDAAWDAWCLNAKPAAKPEEPADHGAPKPADWENAASFFARSGRWFRDIGPEPGQAGCRCPREILEKHGINPDTGEVRRKRASG
jgi:Protein of unknown function (DUF1376)